MTILIAEDAPVDAIILRNIVTHSGHVPLVVGDGKEALLELDRRPEVVLVLADVHMPEMGGVDLLRTMRENPTLADVPVVFVSGAADAKTVQEAVALRPAGYLLKPLNEPSRMLELVSQALERVTPFLTGDPGDPRYRNERLALASALRAELGEDGAGEDGAGEAAPVSGDLTALAKKAGAPRLAHALGPDGPSAGDAMVRRALRGTLNVLESRGY